MSAAIVEFSNEVSARLKAAHGEQVGNEFMGIYHKLNGSPFKNFAWLKEIDFVARQQEADTPAQRKRNLEAIVAGLELFKDLRAYGKIYQHYKKELDGGAMPAVVEAVMPEAGHNGSAPHLVVSEAAENIVIQPEPAVEVKKAKRVRKPKAVKTELPKTAIDIAGNEVPIVVAKTQKKSPRPAVVPSSEAQSPSPLTEEKKTVMIAIKPKMTDKQKHALMERVKKLLWAQ